MKDAIKFYNEFCLQHDLDPAQTSVDVMFSMLSEYYKEGYIKGGIDTLKKQTQ